MGEFSVNDGFLEYLKNTFGFEFPNKISKILYFGQILSFAQIQNLNILEFKFSNKLTYNKAY